MNTLAWLLKREYWEHRGGFLWAPVWCAGALLLLMISGIVLGEMFGGSTHIQVGIPIDRVLAEMSSADLRQLAEALNGFLFGFAAFIQIVLSFVVFFYLLGALYDDRRDRSVLFWKSLPIADSATVASKLLTAALTAPLLALAVTIALHIAVLLILSLLLLAHGGNPLTLIWGAAAPQVVWAKLLVMIPLNALWALPAYGWLLLCSAFARSKPFLWAVVPPVLLGWLLLLSSQDWAPRLWYWRDVVGRILLGVIPGSWAWRDGWFSQLVGGAVHIGPAGSSVADSPGYGYAANWSIIGQALAMPAMWIGALAGLALLAGAVWLRGRRIETNT